jgi:hypothetical protein
MKTTLISIERLTRNRFRPQKSRPPPQEYSSISILGCFLYFNPKFYLKQKVRTKIKMFRKASDYPRFIACKTVNQLNLDVLTNKPTFHSLKAIVKKQKSNNPYKPFLFCL